LDFDAICTIREKGVNELDEFGIDWYIYEFLNQPVVPHLIEDPLYVEKNSESALLRIDGEAFGPESKLLRRKHLRR
jgi:hypothetical protein